MKEFNIRPTKTLPLWKPALWLSLSAIGWAPVIGIAYAVMH